MTKGFFFENKQIEEQKSKKEENLCDKCGLYKTCITPKMKYTGQGRKKILIIAEAPGKNEDELGVQLVGIAGITLRKHLRKLNISLEKDCWKTNSIICRPKNNKTPTIAQINYCRPNLLKTIEKLKPEKIITLGKIALQSLIGQKISITGVEKWVGWAIPDQDYKCWIFPNYHPQFLNYNKDDIILQKNFYKYLKNAINHDKSFIDYNDYKVEILHGVKEITDYISSIENDGTIVFDFETNSLRSQYKESKVVCMSIYNKGKVVAFPIIDELIEIIADLLENKNIKKIACNCNFENSWTKHFFKVDVNNWYWDTMIASHVLDNRHGINGLKFQTYVNFGIVGYDNDVKSYLESKEKFNNIDKVDLNKLLFYCGLDSYFTYKIYRLQKKAFRNDSHLEKGFMFFMEGLRNLMDVHLNGIKFDDERYHKNHNELSNRIDKLHDKIMNSKEVSLLKNKSNFNYNSSKQLRELLFDVCKWESDKETRTGLSSVDADTLKSFNKPFANDILEIRRLEKIRDTYLKQFKREEIYNYLYPIFNLHTVSSYRPSTSFPNMANVPKREEEAKRIVRETIIPKNDYLVEIDYSGIEVMVAACYTKDSQLINYIKDESTDMHRDTAADLFCIDKNEVTKEIRYIAKNKFVFPQFYGDYYITCAKNIWEYCNKDQKQILKNAGFRNIQKFENHVKQVEDIFWNKRFKEYNDWKIKNYEFYLKNGYVEFKTGFRACDRMRRNQVNNLAFQGSAFHILLWSLCQINKYLKENNYKTQIINQVYDCILFDVMDNEWEKLLPIIKKIMLEDVRKYFEWIIIPLQAEVTYYKDNWANEIKEENL